MAELAFFNILATFAEFEVDLLRARTREGWRSPGQRQAQGQSADADRRQAHLVKLHAAGEHTIGELAELFCVSRATVYRVLDRAAAQATAASWPGRTAGGVLMCGIGMYVDKWEIVGPGGRDDLEHEALVSCGFEELVEEAGRRWLSTGTRICGAPVVPVCQRGPEAGAGQNRQRV